MANLISSLILGLKRSRRLNCYGFICNIFTSYALLSCFHAGTLGGGLFICYRIAVYYKHVVAYPQLPYLSSIGVKQPERGLFTLFLNVAAVTAIMQRYVFYRYVVLATGKWWVNTLALCVGVIQAFGMVMLGTFSWIEAPSFHRSGSRVAMIGMLIYSMLVCVVTHHQLVMKSVQQYYVLVTRMCLLVMQVLYFTLFIYEAFVQKVYYNPASAYEWVTIYLGLGFSLSLAFDLSKVKEVDMSLRIGNKLQNNKQEGIESY